MTDTTILTQPDAQTMYDTICAKLAAAQDALTSAQAQQQDLADKVKQLEQAKAALETLYGALFQAKPTGAS